jgi:superoxide reductase
MRLGEVTISPEQEGKEKHVPVIEAPDKVEKGERFQVTVHVGKQTPHPNTREHHIEWVQLFAKEDGDKPVVEVAQARFGATYGEPIATFTVMLPGPAELIAVELCNIHGLWDYSKRVEVEE